MDVGADSERWHPLEEGVKRLGEEREREGRGGFEERKEVTRPFRFRGMSDDVRPLYAGT